jgi:hypothetical protein
MKTKIIELLVTIACELPEGVTISSESHYVMLPLSAVTLHRSNGEVEPLTNFHEYETLQSREI